MFIARNKYAKIIRSSEKLYIRLEVVTYGSRKNKCIIQNIIKKRYENSVW